MTDEEVLAVAKAIVCWKRLTQEAPYDEGWGTGGFDITHAIEVYVGCGHKGAPVDTREELRAVFEVILKWMYHEKPLTMEEVRATRSTIK